MGNTSSDLRTLEELRHTAEVIDQNFDEKTNSEYKKKFKSLLTKLDNKNDYIKTLQLAYVQYELTQEDCYVLRNMVDSNPKEVYSCLTTYILKNGEINAMVLDTLVFTKRDKYQHCFRDVARLIINVNGDPVKICKMIAYFSVDDELRDDLGRNGACEKVVEFLTQWSYLTIDIEGINALITLTDGNVDNLNRTKNIDGLNNQLLKIIQNNRNACEVVSNWTVLVERLNMQNKDDQIVVLFEILFKHAPDKNLCKCLHHILSVLKCWKPNYEKLDTFKVPLEKLQRKYIDNKEIFHKLCDLERRSKQACRSYEKAERSKQACRSYEKADLKLERNSESLVEGDKFRDLELRFKKLSEASTGPLNNSIEPQFDVGRIKVIIEQQRDDLQKLEAHRKEVIKLITQHQEVLEKLGEQQSTIANLFEMTKMLLELTDDVERIKVIIELQQDDLQKLEAQRKEVVKLVTENHEVLEKLEEQRTAIAKLSNFTKMLLESTDDCQPR